MNCGGCNRVVRSNGTSMPPISTNTTPAVSRTWKTIRSSVEGQNLEESNRRRVASEKFCDRELMRHGTNCKEEMEGKRERGRQRRCKLAVETCCTQGLGQALRMRYDHMVALFFSLVPSQSSSSISI